MRVAISGPTGAIGHALIAECIKNNIEVLAICRKGSNRKGTIPDSSLVHVLELSLDEYSDCDVSKLIEDYGTFDVFYHFAWMSTIGDGRNDMKLQHKNIGYALDAVKLAKGLGCVKFIGAGSQAEYGRVEGKLHAQTPAFPENGYGMAKLCAGQMTGSMCKQLGMEHVWVRILSVYGPYDGEMTMVTSTLRKLCAGQIPEFTKGEQQWDYLYSGDAARALLLIAEKGKTGKIYPIGSGQTKPLAEYIRIMCDVSGCNIEPRMGAVPYAENQVMYLCADIGELTKDTGFVPEISFEDGIKKTVEWIKGV